MDPTPLPRRSSLPANSPQPYPFAAAPDIIRVHQKDAYFQGHLANSLASVHRLLLGARSAHAWTDETRTFASLLYLGLTTLPGNRTLGEEYCDVVQLHAPSGRLPSRLRRTLYILSTVLAPYAIARLLPSLRARIRAVIERRLASIGPQSRSGKLAPSREAAFWRYVLSHLSTIASPGPIHALTLTLFYFSGTYYELPKRLFGLRYIFTRTVPDTPDRAGYEVLGALLVVQMAVQTYLHIRQVLATHHQEQEQFRERHEPVAHGSSFDVSLDEGAFASNTDLLLSSPSAANAPRIDIEAVTHTPPPPGGVAPSGALRHDLTDDSVMAFIKGDEQRKCTLCLEPMRDPSATQCGHVFCWACIGDWVREKPECPLCRREAMVQHILPLRVI